MRLRAKFPMPPDYDSVEELGRQMEEDLWKAIDEEFPKAELVRASETEIERKKTTTPHWLYIYISTQRRVCCACAECSLFCRVWWV